jgi:hypothetical protein
MEVLMLIIDPSTFLREHMISEIGSQTGLGGRTNRETVLSFVAETLRWLLPWRAGVGGTGHA